ncbi:MAG TPA: alpha/beta fold hydrolase, partial [Longimicrobiaceae bacterium]|nr:alpha/beta fold hydrolase [Longimicrobiaceae bacterium]
DRTLAPQPVGIPGELLLGGPGLARGYLGRPDLTAAVFIPDPFGSAPGERIYRTGDLVRRLADGMVHYLGRIDHQVKIRGFRIELGEIEAALGRHPGVGDGVAVVREDTRGDRRIVAYATAAPGADPSPAELRAHLAAHLPEYMVPAAVVVLEAMPLSPNGKLDRRALPAPDWTEQGSGAGYVPPRDALELVLAGIWEEVLGTRPVGVRDSFFERGGHSLLAVRLMARVEEATGARLPLALLFTAPTVEALAEVLRREQPERDTSLLVPIRTAGDRRPLFLVHAVGGDVLSYAPLAAHLPPEQPLYGLRARGLTGGGAPHATVEAMAADYLEALRAVQPGGPYRLGGWSMGGVVAFEMARRLEAAGERVERLVLIDSHLPALHGRTLPDDRAVRVRIFAQDLGIPVERLPLPAGEGGEGAYLRRALEEVRAAGLVPAYVDAERIEQLYRVFRANLEALYAYRPQGYGGAVTLLRAAEHPPEGTPTAGWERIVAGGVEVRRVPGSHFTLVRGENARALAREITQALEGAEGEG